MNVWTIHGPDYCSDCGRDDAPGIYADTEGGRLLALVEIERQVLTFQRAMKSDPRIEIEPNTRDALGGWDITASWEQARYPHQGNYPPDCYTRSELWCLRENEVQGA